ncbi:MAG: type II toxin-antitoxin system RelE/ParE family toxin [Prochlorothrix sp.]
MAPVLNLTQPAIADLEEIADRIAQNSGLERSEQFLASIEEKLSIIARFPKIGRLRSEILPNLRSLPLQQYLILYIPVGESIDVLRVVSGYRDLPALFPEEP